MHWFKKEYHSHIYIFGLFLLAASLTLAPIFMSIAEFILLFNWLAEGNFKNKIIKINYNKAVLAFLLIYFVHIVGLFYTNNFSFAISDLRIKLPLLALPIIISTTPVIRKKIVVRILLVHIAATFLASIIGLGVFLTNQINDMRDISIFISHIRFSLNICLDIFILIYLLCTKQNFGISFRIVFGLLILWFVYFLTFMESLTGVIILFVVSIIMLIIYIFKKTPTTYKIGILSFLIITIIAISLSITSIYKDYHKNTEILNSNKVENYTKHGGVYKHYFDSRITDNGYYTWMYICDEELEKSWNKRSKIRFDSTDRDNQSIRYTLIRFLTSKGLRKDMDGVNSLTDDEINLIEDGVANVDFAKKGSFTTRLKSLIWEYENYKITGDPRNKSIMQRVELWESSIQLIKIYPLFGVGTGDPADVFKAYLEIKNSLLRKSNLRSHNQYLTIAIAFGTIGLLVFLFGLIYPGIKLNKFSDFLYLSFFIIAILSMLTEDTLETQAGVTFFTFFSCLFLFAYKNDDPD